MRLTIFISLLFVCISTLPFCQSDEIYLLDSTAIEVKVENIGTEQIKQH
jgi:hypothetical protein